MKPENEVGRKDDQKKLERYDLIPVGPLRQLAALYGLGAQKYGERNWEQGIDFSRVFAALQRHAWAWWGGQEIDPDNGQHHLAAVAWNAFALLELLEKQPQFDNRPSTVQNKFEAAMAECQRQIEGNGNGQSKLKKTKELVK